MSLNDCNAKPISFGIDSLKFVQNIIQPILYPKPQTLEKLIKDLELNSRTKLFFIGNKKHRQITCFYEIKSTQQTDKVLIFSHGNACDIYSMYSYLKSLANNLNVNVVCYDYPSYGLSKGELNEHTCYRSLHDVIWYWKNKTEKILLVGQSLGTGIVVDYISKNNWTQPVVLISPYKSIPKVITQVNLFELVIVNNRFDTWNKISKCTCPIKIFHGKSDKVIEVSHGIDLYEKLPNKLLNAHFFNNCAHNDILDKISWQDWSKLINML